MVNYNGKSQKAHRSTCVCERGVCTMRVKIIITQIETNLKNHEDEGHGGFYFECMTHSCVVCD